MTNERASECVERLKDEHSEHSEQNNGRTRETDEVVIENKLKVGSNGNHETKTIENPENAEEAESYLKNVMQQNVVAVSALSGVTLSSQPLPALETPVRIGKKRHLSLPNIQESKMKKVKADKDCNSEQGKISLGEDSTENKQIDEGVSKQERVTLRVRRSILPNKERLKVTKGKDNMCNKAEGGNVTQTKPRTMGESSMKKEKQPKQNKDTKTREITKTTNKSETGDRFHSASDTSVILKALDDMKSGLESKIDTIDKKNNEKLEKLQSEMNNIRTDFNQRLEGLAKKVELRVLKAVENDTKEKLKKLEKDMRKDIDKMKRNIDRTETEVKRLSETDIPTIQERLGDEIDSITERVAVLERNKTETCRHNDKENLDDRKRRIVIRNLTERENENVKDRVNNIIEYLKVKDISVETAERKPNNYNSKPGVIIATFYRYEDKEHVMRLKKNLKYSTRYRDVYIENGVPAHQRKLKSNLRTIVNTLGREKLRLRGSRIIRADEHFEYESREENRNTERYHHTEETRSHYNRPNQNSQDRASEFNSRDYSFDQKDDRERRRDRRSYYRRR